MSTLYCNDVEYLKSVNDKKKVLLKDGTAVPSLGQGTWYMGENPRKAQAEIDALRLGIELGMTLIDTAEMYGDGKSEIIVGEAIKKYRNKVFLVSKVYPHNAELNKISKSCENSLNRLKTDHMDLYLLHWRGAVPLEETIEGMERLIKAGKILRWGVSNFDTHDMKEIALLSNGKNCSVNQILYHLGSRGIEYDLLDFQQQNQIPVMAYCPIAQAGSLRRGLFENKTVKELAEKYQVNPVQILLAWCMRSDKVMAIPKAASISHVLENARSNTFMLTKEDLQRLDAAYPKPNEKVSLDMV